MKRLLPILLILFFLAGCAGEEIPETSDPSLESTAEPAPDPGIYVADSAIEQHTGGAVRAYAPEEDDYRWLGIVGNRVLLGADAEYPTLSCFLGDELRWINKVSVGEDLSVDSASWQITVKGLAYYHLETGNVEYLSSTLTGLGSVALPEDAVGNPLIDPINDNIYYCTEDQIRVLDPDTGISQLIRQQSNKGHRLLGIYFDGRLLACAVNDASGEERTVYISTQTGELISADDQILMLSTYENDFFALRQDGTIRQQIFGTATEGVTAQNLNLSGDLIPVLSLGGVVRYAITEEGLNLDFYALSSGMRTASVTLPGVKNFVSIKADKSNIWILTDETSEYRLLRWDVQKSPVEDGAVLSGPVYTATSPDEAGLQACQQRVDALNKTHGLAIRIWQDAVKEPGGYVLEPEYQVAVINKCLDELEPVLAMFPENFLYKSVNTRVRICIVRSVSDEVRGLHYWLNDDSFIILSAGVNIREEFLKAVGYVVSTNVMGNSPILDGWASLNPEGFTYGGEGFEQYLQGEVMAFPDAGSMESITEDRSRLFWYAMKEDNAQMFQAPAMQAKLLLLCRGIRDAWRLEKKTDVYPWEQYLHESIAYVKK